MHKGLIKYIKVNGITPMTVYVQSTYPKLFVIRKQQLQCGGRTYYSSCSRTREEKDKSL